MMLWPIAARTSTDFVARVFGTDLIDVLVSFTYSAF